MSQRLTADRKSGGVILEGQDWPSVHQRTMITHVLRRINDDGPSRQVLCEILDDLAESLACERIFLFLLRPTGGFYVVAARNRDRENLSQPAERISHFAVQQLVEAQDVVFVPEARQDRRHRTGEASEGRKRALSILVAPLFVNGQLRGGVYADHRLQGLSETAPGEGEVAELIAAMEVALHLRDQRDRLSQNERALTARVSASSAPGDFHEGASTNERLAALLEQDGSNARSFRGLISANPDLLDTFDMVETLRSASLPVLIRGETGTGKGCLAKAVHECSVRSGEPFLEVACGALAEGLIESELLGHVRGAFTGAESDHTGIFVRADGGTVFLDEVEDMSPGLQTKLLRVLADGAVRAIGAKDALKVDVRLVCATKESLERRVEEGLFREDLYFRLKGVVLEVPPLRERREDILLLADYFLARHAEVEGVALPEMTREARLTLLRHGWSGNVRELENEMRRLVAIGIAVAGERDLALTERHGSSFSSDGVQGGSRTLAEVVHLAEREAIVAALRQCLGNKSKAAEALGITRKALYRRLSKYDISAGV